MNILEVKINVELFKQMLLVDAKFKVNALV